MELTEIEHKIACGELTAAQVFTQMKQHIIHPTCDSCKKVDYCLTLKIFHNYNKLTYCSAHELKEL